VTSLLLLLVGALANPLTEGRAGHWLVLIIPFEASILGLFWLDHAGTRRRMRAHIIECIEKPVNELLNGYRGLTWEHEGRGKHLWPIHDEARTHQFQFLHESTFKYPSLATNVLLTLFLLITFPPLKFLDRLDGPISDLERFFPLSDEFGWIRWPAIFAVVCAAWYVYRRYKKSSDEYWPKRADDEKKY
jgi:hypothetical protein